jgi:hypothetical protein
VQIIPGSFKLLPVKGTARFIALLNDVPVFVFYGDLLWREDETLVLPNEMCGQTLLVNRKFDADVL